MGSIPSPCHHSCLWAEAGLSSMGIRQNGPPVLAVGPLEDTPQLSAFLSPFSKVLIPLRWPQLCTHAAV